jgi:hypothetical protein
MEQLHSHIWDGLLIYVWLNIYAFPHILGNPSSYMTLQLLHSDSLIYEENFLFFFYQCVGDPILGSWYEYSLALVDLPVIGDSD